MTQEWGPRQWDPGNRLSDPHINPAMRAAVEAVFSGLVSEGLHPRIGPKEGGFRSPEEADALYEAHIHNGGPPAAPAWRSAHNYGLGLDIYLVDNATQLVHDTKEPGDDYARLVQAMKGSGFGWGGDWTGNKR